MKVLHSTGKLSSGYRNGKGLFSFRSQIRAMPKNVQTTMLISQADKVMLKILEVRLQKYGTNNFQMYKLGLEKAKEPEIKLPTFIVS